MTMRLSPTTESIKAKADRYYAAQCKRLAAERRELRALTAAPAVVLATITPSDPKTKRKRVTRKVKP